MSSKPWPSGSSVAIRAALAGKPEAQGSDPDVTARPGILNDARLGVSDVQAPVCSAVNSGSQTRQTVPNCSCSSEII